MPGCLRRGSLLISLNITHRGGTLKILLTTHQFLPEFFAGTEILTFEIAKELQRLGHEVLVFAGFPAPKELDDADRFDRYIYEGIPVERFHHSRSPMGGQTNIVEAEYNNVLVASHLQRYVQEHKPDVVHFIHLARLSASAVDVCSHFGIPMVLTPTDFWYVCPTSQLRLPDNSLCSGPDRNGVNCLRHVMAIAGPPNVRAMLDKLPDWLLASLIQINNEASFLKGWIFPWVRALSRRPDFLKKRINMVDRVIVPTRLMASVLKNHGVNPKKIIFSPYGVSLHNYNKISRFHKSFSSCGDKLRIGFIGTLYEHKGAHLLVKAIRSLPNYEPIELKVYGRTDESPQYMNELMRIVNDDRRIIFLGTFPNKQIGHVLSSIDVLVVPSIWYENTPLVIYYAQAVGCPVIASNMEGIAEVVHHGENGLLFEPGDVQGLAEAIKNLATDRELLDRLSKNARMPRSLSEYVEELVAIYIEVIEEKLRTI